MSPLKHVSGVRHRPWRSPWEVSAQVHYCLLSPLYWRTCPPSLRPRARSVSVWSVSGPSWPRPRLHADAAGTGISPAPSFHLVPAPRTISADTSALRWSRCLCHIRHSVVRSPHPGLHLPACPHCPGPQKASGCWSPAALLTLTVQSAAASASGGKGHFPQRMRPTRRTRARTGDGGL